MRDPEFAETLQNFYTTSTLSDKALSETKARAFLKVSSYIHRMRR